MLRLAKVLPVLLVAGLAAGQEESAAVFRADARLVVLHATVVDGSGRLVTNLSRIAFRVYEDGVEQTMRVFRREDVPVSMGIIIDNSMSMKGKRSKVEAAAANLVAASNPQDEVFVINFNDEAYRDADFTSDIQKLAKGLARIDSRGGTAVRDALLAGIRYAKAKGRNDKKVLVVVTDGEDNMSGATLPEVVREAQQSEVLVYVIGLLSEEERAAARRAERELDEITRATGGQAWYPAEVGETGRIALAVAHDIRNQYILAYTPSNPKLDGRFRQIRVTAGGGGRLTVRTRTGYWATPDLGTRPVAPPAPKPAVRR
ncbi:MAG: VWA domain-containing protein [Bryobacteraceae bacterium]